MGLKNNIKGQTALILILIAAATLIFLAITLNWGRIAQVKALITVAADESASQLASDTASYGEMEKQSYLKDTNQVSASTSIFLAIILVVIAIIITIVTWGTGVGGAFALVLAVLATVMAVANLVLQVVVVQPGITSLWNSLQKNQPIQQQFYEQGIVTALQGSVTDQVKITDYFDSNANGLFGVTGLTANDSISRFALFYTDRLKMLNSIDPPIPQVVLFYNQLGELMNGETCDENANDVTLGLGVAQNPACAPLNCVTAPADPDCTQKIPGSFQLNDACTSSNPGNPATYNPYCDPCCQPQYVPGSSPPVPLRPISCGGDAQCIVNNPYGGAYLDIYDPSFQNYAAGSSFLDLMGRDQQMGPFTALTPDVMSPAAVIPPLEFPNGIFPFFWLMNNYSPEVDKIDPSSVLLPSQYHWCVAGSPTGGGPVPTVPTPAGFPDLAQLALPYACVGSDCCVNQISTSAPTFTTATSPNISITITGGPAVNITNPLNGSYISAGSGYTLAATATEPSGGTITDIEFFNASGGITDCADITYSTCTNIGTSTASISYLGSNAPVGVFSVYAVATDNNGITAKSATISVNVVQPVVQVNSIVNAVGGIVTAGSTAKITATVTGLGAAPAGFISSVQIFNKGILLGTATLTAGSYVYTWTNVPAGNYSLTAAAKDQNGFVTSTIAGSALTGTVT